LFKPAWDLSNLTSIIGSMHMANAESGDDSIYNMSRPTTEQFLLVIFLKIILFLNFAFLLLIFTSRKQTNFEPLIKIDFSWQ